MMNERIVVGMDIGTTKVCAVVASVDAMERINILGVGVAESEGLNRGVVVNIDKTVAAVQQAIREAERAAGVTVRSVIVGIAGDHVQSFQSRGVVTISNRDGEITQRDVQRLLEDTTHVAMPADREILHVIPQEFIVDGQDGVADPVGMSGVRLEANVHIITGLVTAAKNIYRCIEKAGYEVADIVLEPLASSFSVLHKDEKEVGVALIDIGGGTTDIAVFEDNTIRHTAVIAVAGNKVTDDIRKGLGMMRDQAERLKCRFGTALADLVEEDTKWASPALAGARKKVSARVPWRRSFSRAWKKFWRLPALRSSAADMPGTWPPGPCSPVVVRSSPAPLPSLLKCLASRRAPGIRPASPVASSKRSATRSFLPRWASCSTAYVPKPRAAPPRSAVPNHLHRPDAPKAAASRWLAKLPIA